MFSKLTLLAFAMVVGTALRGFSQIKIGDTIEIVVDSVPHEDKRMVEGRYSVKNEGQTHLPYVGRIDCAGKTAEQIAEELGNAYKVAEIYTNPKFQVSLAHFNGIKTPLIWMGGSVKKTGAFVFEEGMTLAGAIDMSGGVTKFGDRNKVRIYRKGNILVYDLTKKEDSETPLERNDTVGVPAQNPVGE